MTSEGKTEVQYVRKFTKFDILISTLMVLSFAFVGGSLFVLLVLTIFPTSVSGNVLIFFTLWFFFPLLLGLMALFRNHIVAWIFGKLSGDGIFQFAVFWNRFPLLLGGLFVISFLYGAFREPKPFLVWFTFFPLFMSLYFIFERSLSDEGVIQILFEGLFSSLNNFRKRQYYWKKISRIIENSFRMANIQISSDVLVYHLNKKLLETNEDVSDDLRSIEAWLLGRQNSCFESIKKILPEVEIKPCTKDSFLKRFLKQVLENPTETQADIIKSIAWLIFFAFIVVTLLIVRPDLLGDVLSRLLGK